MYGIKTPVRTGHSNLELLRPDHGTDLRIIRYLTLLLMYVQRLWTLHMYFFVLIAICYYCQYSDELNGVPTPLK